MSGVGHGGSTDRFHMLDHALCFCNVLFLTLTDCNDQNLREAFMANFRAVLRLCCGEFPRWISAQNSSMSGGGTWRGQRHFFGQQTSSGVSKKAAFAHIIYLIGCEVGISDVENPLVAVVDSSSL